MITKKYEAKYNTTTRYNRTAARGSNTNNEQTTTSDTPVTPPSEECEEFPFKLTSLTATDADNNKRKATSGQTLYYVYDGVSFSSKITNFKFDYSNNTGLDFANIDKDKIQWYFDEHRIGGTITHPKPINNVYAEHKTLGRLALKTEHSGFSMTLNRKNPTIVTVYTGEEGCPEFDSKNVSIEWINQYKNEVDVVPAGVKNALTLLSDYVNNIGAVLKKLDGTAKLEFNISFTGEESVEEDDQSRFYYITKTGGFGGSIDLVFKGFKYGADLKIAKVEVFLKPIISLSAEGSMQFRKRNDQKTFIKNGMSMEFKLNADLQAGGEIGFDIYLVTASAKPYGGISSWGKIEYNSSKNKIEGNLGIGKPYVAIEGEVKTVGGYNILPSGGYRHTWEDINLSFPITIDLNE